SRPARYRGGACVSRRQRRRRAGADGAAGVGPLTAARAGGSLPGPRRSATEVPMAPDAHLAALTPFLVEQTPPDFRGGVVAIGNFDGVHRGHVALLEAARREAKRPGTHTLVLTFEPHPRAVLRPDTPVFRLTPIPAKARLLKAIGIDGLAVAPFDRAFAA